MALAMLSIAGAAWAAPSPSEAERNKAAEHVFAGDEKRQAGDHLEALEQYEQADAIMNVPTTGIEVAKELAAVGKLIEAQQRAVLVEKSPDKPDEPEAFARAREQAAALAKDLETRIPRARIVVQGTEEATIEVDGEVVSSDAVRLNPGEHTFVARAEATSARATITLKEGDDRVIELVLEPHSSEPVPDPKPDEPVPTEAAVWAVPLISWVGFGVGAAGIVAGTITGILTLDTTSFLQAQCPGGTCSSDYQSDVDRAVTLSHVSTISFAVGGAGAALGALMLVLSLPGDDEATDTASVVPQLGLGRIGVKGSF